MEGEKNISTQSFSLKCIMATASDSDKGGGSTRLVSKSCALYKFSL